MTTTFFSLGCVGIAVKRKIIGFISVGDNLERK